MNNDMVILVVDDERNHADVIVESLEKLDARAIAVYNVTDALEIIRSEKVGVVVTDLKFEGDSDGLTVLREARANDEQTQVILITAYATIDNCKEAIKQGAYDYLVKPIDIDQLRALVEQAARKVTKSRNRKQGANKTGDRFHFDGVRSQNPRMQHIFEVLRRVAPTNIAVLIEGKSGTGKELMARAIHQNSSRTDKPFKPVNCAGLTESLLESELFGHTKGAFTGAANDRKGLIETADEGTLFLDEIGDMPLNMQAKLLRVLEDGIVMPVGSNRPIAVDVRLISATNHDLAKLIEQSKFREDLYFRIKGVSISLPRLKDRPEDIHLLAEHFRKEAAREVGSNADGFTEAAKQTLANYSWPGNIRQLKNCVRTMVVMCDRDKLDIRDIPPEIHQPRQLGPGRKTTHDLGGMSLDELEKQAIIDTLARTNNNREKASKILGIGERTLYRKIKAYNINT